MGIIAYIEEFNAVSIAVRLLCAAIMGALIGYERAGNNQAAGVRTFAIVCLGAALAQIVDIRCIIHFGNGDPVRLSQGVINGIGFLGVGTIIVTKDNHIKGLTTAAALWTTAILGICVGTGYVWGSIMAFALVFIVIKCLSAVTKRINKHTREIELIIEVKDNDGTYDVVNYIRDAGYEIVMLEKKKHDDYVKMNMEIKLNKKMEHSVIIDALYKIEKVKYIQEIR